jgi:uncharacterized protein (UPF0332 family)
MTNIPADQAIFLAKSDESLAGAASELAAGRYNNCANRCYYACFQAAIAALMQAGVGPTGARGEWGHAHVQREFSGRLINRRKEYPGTLRDVLGRLLVLRRTADYRTVTVSDTQAARAMRHAREFVGAVRNRLGDT